MSAKKASKLSPAKVKLAAGAMIRAALSPEQQTMLGLLDDATALDMVVELIRDDAKAKQEAARRKAAARVPLVAPRYAKTLAQGILATLTAHAGAKTVPAPWASLAQSALHASYMAASVPTLSTHDAHPGSRAGVVMVDMRKPEEFSTSAGELTFASVLARVTGEPRP